jgi:ferredoxin, 2Fe-2S
MPKIIFEQPDGSERAVDMDGVQSVMEGAVRASVRGIDADCPARSRSTTASTGCA